MASNIDLEMYDRQNRAYGVEATTNLSNSTIVIIGLSGGLATESCKNLLLSGVQKIILIEDGNVEQSDLATGFYYTEDNIGNPRHQVLASKLSELNPYSSISHSSFDEIELSNKYFLLHNLTKTRALEINKLCRENNSKFAE